MKISINTIAQLNEVFSSALHPASEGVDNLVRKIGSQLGAVEEVEPFGRKYEGVIIARVVTCEKHPNADRLSVCMIDDAGVAQNVQRDDRGYVQVICGAPNVREGIMVAWLPPGSTVPESYEKDPFVLDARELRGVISNGMLASPKELAINDLHEGILEIEDDIHPGVYLVDAVNLRNDSIIDIENKMFTHRPDCFGWLGVAREIAGIQHQSYSSPQWYTDGSASVYDSRSETSLPLVVKNDIPELVPRFITVTLSDVTVKSSPLSMQFTLLRHGIRPINNVVDITNYMMLLTGQPLHAYDYDKVRSQDGDTDTATIGARQPNNDEQLQLLNGKSIQPRENSIVITSATKALGLGGVMGGNDTEVDESTKNIILESATFDMYSIRRTAMAHGIFTDAVTRFNKGQSPLQNKVVAEKAIEMLQVLSGAKLVEFHDDMHVQEKPRVVDVDAQFINARLGLGLSNEDMAELLRNVEFAVTTEGDQLHISVPFWRTDIEIAEDIVEEVGRLFGYDALPQDLPKRSITPTVKDSLLSLKQRIRTNLVRAGAHEVLTYSFVHGKLLHTANQDTAKAFQLSNALSPELQYYRLSLQPSLLDRVHMNIKAGYGEFALFEIGKAHAVGEEEDGLPVEWNSVAMVYAANTKKAADKAGAPFYQARQFATELLDNLGMQYDIIPMDTRAVSIRQELAGKPFEPSRSAFIVSDDKVFGIIGEYSVGVRRALKLPDYVAGFELSIDDILNSEQSIKKYIPLSRYPKVEQDITFKVSENVPFASLRNVIQQQLHSIASTDIHSTLQPLSIYQATETSDKNISFRISVVSYVKTMTDSEVSTILDTISKEAQRVLQAERA